MSLGQVRREFLGAGEVSFGGAPGLLVAVAVIEQRRNRQLRMRRSEAAVETDGSLEMANRLRQFGPGAGVNQFAPLEIGVIRLVIHGFDGGRQLSPGRGELHTERVTDRHGDFALHLEDVLQGPVISL